MGTYVITPRSEAECNQLASIMHSVGFTTPNWYIARPFRVGVPAVCFSMLDVYLTEVLDHDMINPMHLQVNELYDALVDSIL